MKLTVVEGPTISFKPAEVPTTPKAGPPKLITPSPKEGEEDIRERPTEELWMQEDREDEKSGELVALEDNTPSKETARRRRELPAEHRFRGPGRTPNPRF